MKEIKSIFQQNLILKNKIEYYENYLLNFLELCIFIILFYIIKRAGFKIVVTAAYYVMNLHDNDAIFWARCTGQFCGSSNYTKYDRYNNRKQLVNNYKTLKSKILKNNVYIIDITLQCNNKN